MLIQLFRSVLNFFRHRRIKKNILLKNEIPKNISIYADTSMFRTIIRNLVNNGIKFTNEEGFISIRFRSINEQQGEFSISDTGVGISETDINKIFQTDSKLKGIGTAGERGTGLGLTMCKAMISLHGGQIFLSSTPGEGSTFRFTIPLIEPHI